MSIKFPGQYNRKLVKYFCHRWTLLLIACLLSLWLTSCEQSDVVDVTASPEVTFTASVSPVPIASAVSAATATALPTVSPSVPATSTIEEKPLSIALLSSETIGRFEMLELDIQTDLIANNPFDPEELDIRVEFTSGSGKTMEVGAFWFQEFDYKTRKFVGEPSWKVRFTPTEIGTWTTFARIPQHGLESAPVHFDVIESDNPGFVRVNPSNPRYFAFDDGSFFFPIGINIAWWSGAGEALSDYRKWMDLFAANGGNTIRVWMAEWSFGIEWNNTPLGDYSNRLQRAWLLDQIFQMAEERDLFIMLVLFNCADFNNWQTNGWNGNPYNVKNGGPLELPEQFVTDPTARTFTQRRLNYIVNRWGYSTHLLAWEWWNEVNLAGFPDSTLFPWFKEMTAYLKAHDVNQHLVTNSYAISHSSPSWSLPEMEIIQKHEYADQEKTQNKDLAERVVAGLTELTMNTPPKPALLGEFGYGTEGYGNDVDKTGIHLHNGIWATTFAGYAGSGMYWYWDVYIELYNAWHHFLGLNRFLEGLDLTGYQPFSPLEITALNGEPGQAFGLGLRSDDILVWIRSNNYTVQACESAWMQAGTPAVYFYYLPPLIKDQLLTLRDMDDGEYTVYWFDPQNALWLDPVKVIAENGQLSILIPEFRRDLAARIVLNKEGVVPLLNQRIIWITNPGSAWHDLHQSRTRPHL